MILKGDLVLKIMNFTILSITSTIPGYLLYRVSWFWNFIMFWLFWFTILIMCPIFIYMIRILFQFLGFEWKMWTNEKWLRSWNMVLDFSLKYYKIIYYGHFHLFLYCHHHNRVTERPYTILRFKIFFSDELWLSRY